MEFGGWDLSIDSSGWGGWGGYPDSIACMVLTQCNFPHLHCSSSISTELIRERQKSVM